MKVIGRKTEDVEVDITPIAILRLTEQLIREKHDIPEGAYVDNGNLMVNIEHHTTHSWIEEKSLRPATQQECSAISLIEQLKQYRK